MARISRNKRPKISAAIVGEGITEWYYFSTMRQVERFGFEVKPSIPKHSDFRSILDSARRLAAEGYDYVFCVLDMDDLIKKPALLREYLRERARNRQNRNILFVESMPCFELWFLLHFLQGYSAKVYENFHQLKPELMKYIKDYEKTEAFFRKRSIYEFLEKEGNSDQARQFAQMLLQDKPKSENPYFNYTRVYEVKDKLRSLK